MPDYIWLVFEVERAASLFSVQNSPQY